MVTSPAIKGPVQSDETRDEDRAASVAVCRRGRSEHLSKGLSRSAEPVDIGTECVSTHAAWRHRLAALKVLEALQAVTCMA